MIRTLALLFALVSLISVAEPAAATRWYSDADLAQLDRDLKALMEGSAVVGAQVAVIDRDGVVFSRGYGQTARVGGQPVTPRTLFRVGSISKSITALALMKLIEQGRLKLEDRLAAIAPEVPFDNPFEAEHPLRVIDLLEHTAGWDDLPYADYAFNEPNHSVREYALRETRDRHSHWPPGHYFRYVNGGPAVAGYLVEKFSGLPFDEAVEALVFTPLNMPNASMRTTPERLAATAQSYQDQRATPEPYWHMSIRPSGALVATLEDMSAYVGFLLRRGRLSNGQAHLAESTVAQIERAESSVAARAGVSSAYSKGLFKYVSGGRLWYGHWGKVDGFRAAYGYLPAHGRGIVVNVNVLEGRTRTALLDRVARFAAQGLPTPPVRHQPESLAALAGAAGWYLDRTPDREMAALPLAIATPLKLSIDATADRLLADQTRYRVPAPGLLELEGIDEPTAALVAVNGRFEYLASNRFVQVSAAKVWLPRLLLGLAVLLLLVQLFALPWALWRTASAQRSVGATLLRLSPLLGLLALAALLWLVIVGLLLADGDFSAAGAPSAWSLLVWLLSISVPLFGLLTLWLAWRPPAGLGGGQRVLAALSAIALIGLSVVLAEYGWIGLRTWRD